MQWAFLVWTWFWLPRVNEKLDLNLALICGSCASSDLYESEWTPKTKNKSQIGLKGHTSPLVQKNRDFFIVPRKVTIIEKKKQWRLLTANFWSSKPQSQWNWHIQLRMNIYFSSLLFPGARCVHVWARIRTGASGYIAWVDVGAGSNSPGSNCSGSVAVISRFVRSQKSQIMLKLREMQERGGRGAKNVVNKTSPVVFLHCAKQPGANNVLNHNWPLFKIMVYSDTMVLV